ncbi:hypothetical protein WK22_17810 [Burkholderia multivorans]|nr:hypothetical protein WK22_17810 [Burkholderia multivorans]
MVAGDDRDELVPKHGARHYPAIGMGRWYTDGRVDGACIQQINRMIPIVESMHIQRHAGCLLSKGLQQ